MCLTMGVADLQSVQNLSANKQEKDVDTDQALAHCLYGLKDQNNGWLKMFFAFLLNRGTMYINVARTS